MSKPFYFATLIVLACLTANAAPGIDPTWGPEYWIPAGPQGLQMDKVDTLARKLGTVPYGQGPFGAAVPLYQWYSVNTSVWHPIHLYFSFYAAVPDPSGKSFPWLFSFSPYSYYAFGARNANLRTFLEEAYRQELDPRHADVMVSREYPVKDLSVFDHRMWLSQGYAWQYAAQNDPFRAAPKLCTAWGYFVDVLAVLVVTSLVQEAAAGPKDPAAFSAHALTGIGLIAANRLITVPLGHDYIRDYNRIAGSGYKIPDFSKRVRRPPADTTAP